MSDPVLLSSYFTFLCVAVGLDNRQNQTFPTDTLKNSATADVMIADTETSAAVDALRMQFISNQQLKANAIKADEERRLTAQQAPEHAHCVYSMRINVAMATARSRPRFRPRRCKA
jgi:hypothetical protein